jgi:hypothetical protein
VIEVKWIVVENCVTVASTAALVLGLFYMGAGGHAGWGFLLLANLSTWSTTKKTAPITSPDRDAGK